MSEQDSYRQLVAWLRSKHPLVLAQWESERKRRESGGKQRSLLGGTRSSGADLDRLPADAGVSTVTEAIKQGLEALGISGGTPGVTEDGTPCIHLMKKGLYGQAYEESVTLARIRDAGYRRHLRQIFG
jgi:hypothetical protein